MPNFSFSFVLSGIDTSDDAFVDLFYEAGCDDATLALMKGFVVASFDREAPDYVHAAVSAFKDILKTGAIIERFEPDYLVSQSEIAKRANLSRSAISLYVAGERGNQFPKPCARITTENPLWDWVVVSGWLYHANHVGMSTVIEARVCRTINLTCQQANFRSSLGERRLVAQIEKIAERPLVAEAW